MIYSRLFLYVQIVVMLLCKIITRNYVHQFKYSYFLINTNQNIDAYFRGKIDIS